MPIAARVVDSPAVRGSELQVIHGYVKTHSQRPIIHGLNVQCRWPTVEDSLNGTWQWRSLQSQHLVEARLLHLCNVNEIAGWRGWRNGWLHLF